MKDWPLPRFITGRWKCYRLLQPWIELDWLKVIFEDFRGRIDNIDRSSMKFIEMVQ